MNVIIVFIVDNEEMMLLFLLLNLGCVIFVIVYFLYCCYFVIKNYKFQDYYLERVMFKIDQGVYIGKVIYLEKVFDFELKQLINRSYVDKYYDYIIKFGKGQVVCYDQDRKKIFLLVGFYRIGFDWYMICCFGMDLKDIIDVL